MRTAKHKTEWMKKIGMMCLVLFGVSILSFLLLAATNKDTAEMVARRGSMNVTPEQIAAVRAELGLDQPLPVRYLSWLKSFFTGEFGISLTTFNPIRSDLKKHLPVTAMLVLMSLVWILVITIPVSLLCAYNKNRWFDHIIRVLGISGICAPTFALGIFLMLLFVVHLRWFSQYIGYQLAGSAVVENLFSLPGIGEYLLSGIFIADTAPTAYCVMIVAAVFVAANFFGDVVNQRLCPWTERV